MSKHRNILGKSLRSILEEEISPDRVLSGNKTRCGSNMDHLKRSLYKGYLKNKDSLLSLNQDSTK